MSYLQAQLKAQYANHGPTEDQEELVVYIAKSFEHYYTYDGIEVCGIRVVSEVEAEIERLLSTSAVSSTADGKKKKVRFSIVGYSLGGLIARHALGVLYKRGWFEKELEAVNFVTFATPHVGVRELGPAVVSGVASPAVGLGTRLKRFNGGLDMMAASFAAAAFNYIGAGMLAYTSRQLFLVDRFTVSTKIKGLKKAEPLLLSLSDPALPFLKALSLFQVRCLYGNIMNDQRTCWYTSGVSASDPYALPAKQGRLSGPYIEGYEGVVIDYSKPPVIDLPSTTNKLSTQHKPSTVTKVLGTLGLVAKVVLIGPVWFVVFAGQSLYQSTLAVIRKRQFLRGPVFETFRSVVEVLLDATAEITAEITGASAVAAADSDTDVECECDKAKKEPSTYASGASSCHKDGNAAAGNTTPESTLIKRAKDRSQSQQQQQLPQMVDSADQFEAGDDLALDSAAAFLSTDTTAVATPTPVTRTTTPAATTTTTTTVTTLNLSPTQLQLISNLNTLTWLKFPTHIRHDHAHAAIVKRFEDQGFSEGGVVVRHWVERVFVF